VSSDIGLRNEFYFGTYIVLFHWDYYAVLLVEYKGDSFSSIDILVLGVFTVLLEVSKVIKRVIYKILYILLG
jgi:hypothetical protein